MFLADLVTTNVTHVELSHPATESYMAFETHTCVAVAHAQYQLFALFPPAVPNHSMRLVCHFGANTRLRDLASAAEGSQDTGSRNLVLTI